MTVRLTNPFTRALHWASIGVAFAWLVGWASGDAWAWSQWLFWVPPFAVALPAGAALFSTRLARAGASRRHEAIQTTIMLAAIGMGLWRCVGLGPSGSADPRAVSLLQWNTDWPAGDDPRSLAFLSANPSDMVLMSNRGAISSPDLVRAWAGDGARVVGAGPFALITHLPVVAARQVAVGGKGRQLWWVAQFEVAPPAWNGRTLRIAMVDLPSRPTIAKARIADGLREACETGGLGEVDLVAGDFNATDGSVIIERCFPAFRDALAARGRGWLATWPRAFPLWKIDHVMTGPGIVAAAARTLDPGVSHHRATFAIVVPSDGR